MSSELSIISVLEGTTCSGHMFCNMILCKASSLSLQKFHCKIGVFRYKTGHFHYKTGDAFPPKSSPSRPEQECLAKKELIDKQLVGHKLQGRPGIFCNTFGNSRMTIPAQAVYFRLSHLHILHAWESSGRALKGKLPGPLCHICVGT